MYVLGIDGGGTKTKGVMADQTGRVIAQHTVGASNPNSMDPSVVENELRELFSTLKKQASSQDASAFEKLSAVFAGMSGVDRGEDQALMWNMLKKLLPHDTTIIVDNDGVNALNSGTLGEPGVVNIAGTGSITFGINADKQRSRVGGWGYLIGDPGSGYTIGKDALEAVFQAYDRCGEETSLTRLILEWMGADSPPDLIKKIYEPSMARKVIAPLSQLVVKASDEGDKVAQHILLKAGEDMGKAINCLLMKLFSKAVAQDTDEKSVLVVLTGGVYHRSDWFVPTIQKMLLQSGFKTEIIVPEVQPVAGALVAAWKAVNINVGQEFYEQLVKDGLNQ
jgi:N-acetylglucosamine kinase-like BadF-type ATPase